MARLTPEQEMRVRNMLASNQRALMGMNKDDYSTTLKYRTPRPSTPLDTKGFDQKAENLVEALTAGKGYVPAPRR